MSLLLRPLAYLAAVYLLSCVLYLATIRMGGYGRPFRDSLTPAQIRIKKQSTYERGKVFAASLAVSALFFIVWRPI